MQMASITKKVKKPSWVDVKAKLANFDQAGLIQLVADLYAAEKVNQAFLHARFSIGGDPLEIYKKRIQKALFPNVMGRNSDVKITDAKKAISEYQKAIGLPEGMLELHLCFCEVALDFSTDCGYESDGFFNAVCLQFKKALETLGKVSVEIQEDALDRLYDLRNIASNVGYGLEDDMEDLLAEVNPDDERNRD
jgi:hypothetical protein